MTDHTPTGVLRIGTRSSALALWQAEWVAGQLTAMGQRVELVHIATEGDISTQPLGAIGGQGLFTKAIQRSLLSGDIDLAVHSLKDLPTESVSGLQLAAVPVRENVGDALICPTANTLDALAHGARVGTGSARRRAQLLYARRDLQVADIRGNLDTRLKKLDDGQYDAIILAEAGIRRLGWQQRITQVIPKRVMLPAVGQGALGIEARSDDGRTVAALAALNDAPSYNAVRAERAMLAALRAGCLAPVGGWARQTGERLALDGVVLDNDGTRRICTSVEGDAGDAEAVGCSAAEHLLAQGAAELIAASRTATDPEVP